MARIAPPRDGEPIRLFWTALDNVSGARTKGSEPRYRVRLDAEPDPKIGKRRQVWSTHDTLTEARAHVAAHRADRKRGVLVVVSKLTVAQLLDGWLLSARHLKPSTRHGYQVHLKPVRDRLGTIEVQRLTKASVDELVEHMLRTGGRKGEGRAPSTVRQTLVILEQAMDDAERQGMVVRNVVRLVAKPRQVRQEMKTWTAEQLTTFLDAARGDRFAALWRVAAFGLRRSEVAGLRWQDVDVEAECARVVQTRVTVDGKTVVTGEPKTASGRRTIALDVRTVEELCRLRRLQARERLAAGDCYTDTGLIAVDELGRPIRPELFGTRFAKITKAARLPPIRLHDLRHTAASLLHESGEVSLRTLAAVLGHADASFTLRTYAHSCDESMRTATAVLASLFETRAVGSVC
jgi:integrase